MTEPVVSQISKWVLSIVDNEPSRITFVIDGVMEAVANAPDAQYKFKKGVADTLNEPSVRNNPERLVGVAKLAALSDAGSALPGLLDALLELQGDESTLRFAEQLADCLKKFHTTDDVRKHIEQLMEQKKIRDDHLLILNLLIELNPEDYSVYIQYYHQDLKERGGAVSFAD